MPIQAVQVESNLFTPSTLLSLFVLDGTNIGMPEPFYFLDGSNSSYLPVIYAGQQYIPFPIEMKQAGMNGQGQQVRPTIVASNVNGFVSNLLLQNQSLIGAQFIRQRVFARFLDDANWPAGNPYGTANSTAAYPPEIWYINRKLTENQQTVEWELASLFDSQGIKLPKRQMISIVCSFKYRDAATCGVSGPPVADQNGVLFVGGAGTYGLTLTNQGTYSTTTTYNVGDYVTIYSTIPQFVGLPILFVCLVNGTVGATPQNNPGLWVQDFCPKNIAGCTLRFPMPQPLRFGGFPGESQAPYLITS